MRYTRILVRTPSKLLPDVDYTIDGGKIILTESFLLRRGFCCNTRCRHCPYKGERASAPIVILGLPKAPLVVPPRVASVTVSAPLMVSAEEPQKTG